MSGPQTLRQSCARFSDSEYEAEKPMGFGLVYGEKSYIYNIKCKYLSSYKSIIKY